MIELGLVGYPLGHSFSAEYFTRKFSELGIEGSYKLFPVKRIENLHEVIRENPGLRGFNVTIPYKEKIIPFLDSLDRDARDIGAVNVVKIIETDCDERNFRGYNTDWKGFLGSLEALKPLGTIKDVIILGTGGAALAVNFAITSFIRDPLFVSRNPEKAPCRQRTIAYGELSPERLAEADLIVNCTPLGMLPDVESCPPIPYEAIHPGQLCFDLVYNPETTEFMRRAMERGAQVSNGLDMLHRQADLAWEIWTGPDFIMNPPLLF